MAFFGYNNEAYRAAMKDAEDELTRIPISDIYHDLTGESVTMQSRVRCWIHGDHDPATGFARHNGKYFYHCFACGASGTAIQMVESYLHCSWKDAVQWIADRYAVRLPEPKDFRNAKPVNLADKFPLTNEELALIGLDPYPTKIRYIAGSAPDNPYRIARIIRKLDRGEIPTAELPDHCFFEPDVNDPEQGYVYGYEQDISLRALWNGSKEATALFGTKKQCRDMVLQMLGNKLLESVNKALHLYNSHVWEAECFRMSNTGSLIRNAVFEYLRGLYAIKIKLEDMQPKMTRSLRFDKIPCCPDLTVRNVNKLVL